MSEIAYSLIVETVADMIKTDPNVQEIGNERVSVEAEEGWPPMADKCPWVGVFASEWETDSEDELIGGNNPFRTFFTITIWCYVFALERKTASQYRDRLLAKVKEIFKSKDNRTLRGTVLVTTFEPGEFDHSNPGKSGFLRGVSLKIKCEVRE